MRTHTFNSLGLRRVLMGASLVAALVLALLVAIAVVASAPDAIGATGTPIPTPTGDNSPWG